MNETNETNEAPAKASLGEKIGLASLIGFTAVVGGTQSAGAQDVGSVTTMATDAASDLSPVILGVGGALVGINALFFGVRWVLRTIRGGGRG